MDARLSRQQLAALLIDMARAVLSGYPLRGNIDYRPVVRSKSRNYADVVAQFDIEPEDEGGPREIRVGDWNLLGWKTDYDD
jgi:hypothetical protein